LHKAIRKINIKDAAIPFLIAVVNLIVGEIYARYPNSFPAINQQILTADPSKYHGIRIYSSWDVILPWKV
jgi:hypothetical protein